MSATKSDQKKYLQKLHGARILIIGGSSGIGFAVAEAAIEHGAGRLIISSSRQARVEAAVNKLKDSYPSAAASVEGYPCNLGDEHNLEQSIEALFDKVGELDHIVYTAGDGLAVKPIHEIDFQHIRQAGMVRFFAPLLVAKHGSKHLSPGPASSITLTTGAVSEHPIPKWTVVGSYATGLQGMNRGLALDLKPIRVNLVSPGAVDTELWNGMEAGERKRLMENMAQGCATGRIAQPEDVAEAYLYCMKDHNLTGSMISTNGGHLIM